MPIDLANLPPGWAKPTPAIIATVEKAAKIFSVPEDVIYGVIRKESNFNPKLRGYVHAGTMVNKKTGKAYVSERFQKSYADWKNRRIPGGGGVTFGQMFPKPEDWRPYGLMQMMPYHTVGKMGGIKAGSTLDKMFDVVPNIMLATALLKVLHLKHGNWFGALKEYNGAGSYARQVLAYSGEIGGPVA